MNDKIMAHCWMAYAVGLFAYGHWIAGISASLMVVVMMYDA